MECYVCKQYFKKEEYDLCDRCMFDLIIKFGMKDVLLNLPLIVQLEMNISHLQVMIYDEKWKQDFISLKSNPTMTLKKTKNLSPDLEILACCYDIMAYPYTNIVSKKWNTNMKLNYDEYVNKYCTRFIIL